MPPAGESQAVPTVPISIFVYGFPFHMVSGSHPTKKALKAFARHAAAQSEEEIYKIMERYASLRMWAHCLETWPRETRTPPAGLEPAIFGLEVRRLVH